MSRLLDEQMGGVAFSMRSFQSERSINSRRNHAHKEIQAVSTIYPAHRCGCWLLELVRPRSDAKPNAVSRACQPGGQLLAAILRQSDRARGRSHADAAKRDRRTTPSLAGESILVVGRARYHLRLCEVVERERRSRHRSLL